ncbi:sigma-54 dependent transcriptional regulator [Thiohalobacter sp. IOR34]|uniref:sigma-54-dependent transcriptional regulator n=1 Tax=Thiohalobacter sp. IOR34 TaxID=3057176 RepID=UPI0025B00D3E|nr:sigma-54 dependent transcriptional regulator [Thiohalobacter sp. IOR34]WJW75626.1 sigma-54 dependent transcriptional regulator [Thiohalobacter sp. IOR34]
MPAAHILVVDDEPDIRTLVKEILEDEGYQVTVAENGEAARKARRDRRPDLILLDIWMDDVDGITLLREWSEGGALPCPVIVMSGHGTVETAVEATRLGAYDFIEKPISLAKLLLTVERALEADKLVRENVGLKRQEPIVPEPIGRSEIMQQLREQARRVAAHDTWVLISGEPGTGKKTFAHYLHANSARRNGPFVEVSVGSLSQQTSARELFGSEEDGRLSYGRFEQANGGTLYLDDIADMDEQTQARLLSVLETRNFIRLGGNEPVQVDLRIIAATRQDLEREVAAGRFREDLYYHLNVVPLQVPRLAEHCEDVPELLNYYVDYFVDRENLPYRHFSVAAQNRLRNYAWPGNIRELKNLVQRLLILGAGEEIGVEEVDSALRVASEGGAADALGGVPMDLPLREAREQFEKIYLERQLKEAGGSVGRLAQRVGMERTHLYRKLKALGIDVRKGAS